MSHTLPKWRAVNVQFVKKEKLAIKESEPTPEERGQVLRTFAFSGYKVSFSFDEGQDCYIAALTGKEQTGPDYNKSFMIFHSDFDTLLKCVVYIFKQANEHDSLSRAYDRYYDSDW